MHIKSFHIRYYILLMGCMLAASPIPAYARASYFQMSETSSDNLTPFPKWTGMMGRFERQKKIPDSECDKLQFHPCVIPEWKNFISGLREDSLQEKLEKINDWSNAHPYIVDQLNWGMTDYWETPHEFMTVSGDCEDYAISKYYSLRASGVPAESMRIIIVQDLNLGGIIHAILGVYDNGTLWILDNQIKQVRRALSIYHYRPIYGANEELWWRYYPENNH